MKNPQEVPAWKTNSEKLYLQIFPSIQEGIFITSQLKKALILLRASVFILGSQIHEAVEGIASKD